MKNRFFLSLLFFLPISLAAQRLPTIELGAIASLAYKNSGAEPTPLRVNEGDATFLNSWVLLFGAEVGDDLSLFAEVQTVNGISFVNYGLSAIYQPKGRGYLNFEVGKFLVPFGTFLGRRWASENPFIDFPLIYEYQTVLSAFDLPQDESELLRVRGQGQSFQYHADVSLAHLGKFSTSFSGHLPRAGRGIRIISREAYLTGIQLFGSLGTVNYHLGITNGSLSNPADINNSNAANIFGRVSYTPLTGLLLGTSFSSGTYLDKGSLNPQLAPLGKRAEDFRQNSLGLDLSYSAGHLVFFSELILNRWQTPSIDEHLDARAFYLEGKYTLLTRFYVAARFSQIDFADIDDPSDIDEDGRFRESWDFDVRQLELSLGYRINRHALMKLVGQVNRTQGAPTGDPSDNLFAFQTVVFF